MTKKYNVHLFPVYRVRIDNITANSQTEAIEKALSEFDPHYTDYDDFEYADDFDNWAIVDPLNSDDSIDYDNSYSYEEIDGQWKPRVNTT